MKITICVLLACIVATTYAQGLASLMMGGALSGGTTGSSSSTGASSATSALGARGGNMNQMLYFAALQGMFILYLHFFECLEI